MMAMQEENWRAYQDKNSLQMNSRRSCKSLPNLQENPDQLGAEVYPYLITLQTWAHQLLRL